MFQNRRTHLRKYYAAWLLFATSIIGIAMGAFNSSPVAGAPIFSTFLPITSHGSAAAQPVIPAGEQVEGVASQLIGVSTGGHPIRAYTFGNGPQRVAFIGGIHGGYEWNTVLLAYEAIDYFARHPNAIPHNVTLQIVPAANPDGLQLVTGSLSRFTSEQVGSETEAGRFNQHNVDLNRNWDCNWEAEAWWGVREISGGSAPFSEVESQVLRDFLMDGKPVVATVFWHSAAPGVFPGHCNGRFAAADALAEVYAAAAGYPLQADFTTYTVTGDATDWLAAQGVPAIVVELQTHDQIEWDQNLAGMLETLNSVNQDLD
ncbi:MAG: hypothetical protein KDE54_08890 [Caldilineaceae bacterium]|nr:hypothetical protein [Caldilineaceae bacterium]